MVPAAAARIIQVDTALHLIVLPVSLSGFDHFIGSWVYAGDLQIIIDPGPAASAPFLMAALAELGIRQPDLMLITHIHIDHAGSAGIMARCFQGATLVCHPKAVGHLIDPASLWQGSLKTLGSRIAGAYGPFEPVPQKALVPADQLGITGVAAIATPGHAAHHYSYLIKDHWLFAGEAAGICLPQKRGGLYLRPATPPRFFLNTYLQSLDRLLTCPSQTLCYGHLDWRSEPRTLLALHRDQIVNWAQWIQPWFEKSVDEPERIMEACLQDLLSIDPLLEHFYEWPAEVQQREIGFLRNSIRGYWGYLADKAICRQDRSE